MVLRMSLDTVLALGTFQLRPDGALCLAIIFLHLSGRFHLDQLLLLFHQVLQNERLKDLESEI